MMLISNYQGISEAKKSIKSLSGHVVKAGGFTQGMKSSKMASKTVGLTIDMNNIYNKAGGTQDKRGKEQATKNGSKEPEVRAPLFPKGNMSTRSPVSIMS